LRKAVSDKAVVRTHRRGAALVAALALGIGGIGAQAASAQTGGTTTPGDTTATPTTPTTPSTPSGYPEVFPIPGTHTYGGGFGAARSGRTHQGQDVFAACGTPLVSVSRAKVKFVSFQSLAGNYVVLRYKKMKPDFFYAHMATITVTEGQVVLPGQQVGTVGETGNARGCHLHFEQWLGKWYRGGHPVNPLPALQYWDSYS
jgi:murein DD-endopeptidase MepM/ murein hydrolase activator NlpD